MMPLSGWENFYVIVGSSAGALIGLQFVVITLISQMPIVRDAERASSAFATPTIIHFGSVLLLSAIICAPWKAVEPAAIVLGIVGLAGTVYAIIVARRMQVQTAYRPEFEDWLFHAMLPVAAYATLALCGYLARARVGGAMFGVGAAALVLLFTGIHNAWDAVTYHVFVKGPAREKRPEQ